MYSGSETEDETDNEGAEGATERQQLSDAINRGDAAALLALLEDEAVAACLNDPNREGDTPLHLASLYGQAECVRVLLEAGADAGVRDPDASTPLHDAAAGGYTEVVRLLLASDPCLAASRDDDGDTPLHNAARGSHAACAELLLGAGADPRATNHALETPVQMTEEGTLCREVLVAAEEGLQAGGAPTTA